MLTTIIDFTNRRTAAIWLTAFSCAIGAMLLGRPGEPITVEAIITTVLMSILAVVSLIWAYHRDTIVAGYRIKRYDCVVRNYHN